MQNETPFLIEDGDINMDIVKLDRWLKDYKSRTDLIKLKPGERMCAYCNRKVAYPLF